MSKNLHYTIILYFRTRMTNHTAVENCTDIPSEEYYLFRIYRKNGLSPVVVWLSDAYHFSRAEFLAKPKDTKIDYVLIARPEAMDNEPSSENWDGIGVGNIAGFMGALSKPRVCDYVPTGKQNKPSSKS
jgi:hypothetical protein